MVYTHDYIIVGQGIAGSILAHLLLARGQRVVVIDKGHEQAASRVAAGTINPVTGRKYVKSWRVDDLLPAARAVYTAIGDRLGIAAFEDSHILRVLFTPEDENTWLARSADPLVAQYMIDPADASECAGKLLDAPAYGELTGCMQVRMPAILAAMRSYLAEQEALLEEAIDYKAIHPVAGGVEYKGACARAMIFAEGHGVLSNPYFGHIKWQPVKGEVLHIKIAGAPFTKVIRHRLFITHLHDDIYWVGARYIHQYQDHLPTSDERQYLISELDRILDIPYDIVDHQAGIRPAVSGRRPVLGRHPEHPQLCLFNGLGTKGASLAPFFGRQLVDHLLDDAAIDSEVLMHLDS